MPTQQTVSYWTTCWKWGFIPYPCKKTRMEWCYYFDSVHVYHWFLYCSYDACENGIKYKWSGVCLGFGSSWVYNITKCFKSKLNESGKC